MMVINDYREWEFDQVLIRTITLFHTRFGFFPPPLPIQRWGFVGSGVKGPSR